MDRPKIQESKAKERKEEKEGGFLLRIYIQAYGSRVVADGP